MTLNEPVAERIRTLTLILVRHGETAHNAEARIQGQLDTPLSRTGIAQAEVTGAHLRHAFALTPTPLPRPEFVFSSDLARASETAQIIASVASLSLPQQSNVLRERHYGTWQGKLVSEISELRRTLGDNPPGGETEDAVYARMTQALAMLWEGCFVAPATESACGLVVGHGGALRGLIARALGMGPEGMRCFRLENCSLSVLEFSGVGPHQLSGGRAIRINDSGHLRGADLSAQTPSV